MHSTFVPDDALMATPSVRFGPDGTPPEPRSELTSLGSPETYYDLFRSRHEPELYCAVPKGRPRPAFVYSDRWLSVGHTNEAAPALLGFNREAARAGVRLNGFYLFVAFGGAQKADADGGDGLPWLPRKGQAQPAQNAP
jgi:hypothetical protein